MQKLRESKEASTLSDISTVMGYLKISLKSLSDNVQKGMVGSKSDMVKLVNNFVNVGAELELVLKQLVEMMQENKKMVDILQDSITFSFLAQGERQTTTFEINNKVWLNIDELSKYADIAKGTIYNYVCKGDIPHTKRGGLKFNRQEIDAWLKSDSFNPDEIRKLLVSRAIR